MKGRIVCAIHKTASMFLFELARKITKLDKNLLLISPNLSTPNMELWKSCEQDYLLCPQRHYQPIPKRILDRSDDLKVVCHIRCPKDTLVSQFFSHGFIHRTASWSSHALEIRDKIQNNQIDIDDYCIKSLQGNVGFAGNKSLKDKIDEFHQLRQQSLENKFTLSVIKYEDMVLNFDKWLEDFLTGLELEEFYQVLFEEFSRQFDLKKLENKEEQLEHKRRILPGDHKNKLKSETITKIDSILSSFVNEFGY